MNHLIWSYQKNYFPSLEPIVSLNSTKPEEEERSRLSDSILSNMDSVAEYDMDRIGGVIFE
jgi:hypothetical protein